MSDWYLNNSPASTAHKKLATSNSGTAASTTTGWTVAKTAATVYDRASQGVERAANTFGATVEPSGAPNTGTPWDCFILGDASGDSLTGSFASGAWTFRLPCRAVTSASGPPQGKARWRLWKSANVDGSSATEIGSSSGYAGSQITLSTTVTNTSSATTASITGFALSSEYLFLQVAWEIDVAGGATGADVLVRSSENVALATSPAFTVTFTGTGSAALSPLASSASGAETFTGTGSAALSSLASSASAAETFTGTGAAALSPLASSAGGAETFTATASAALSPLASSASGTVAAGDITGTVDVALSPLASSLSGLETFTGTTSQALSPLAFSASGTESFTGTGAVALSPLASSLAGTEMFTGTGSAALSPLASSLEGIWGFAGEASFALSPLASSATGTQTFTGTASAALSALASSISGDVTAGAESFTGTISQALSALASSATGDLSFTGEATVQFSSISSPYEIPNARLTLGPLGGARLILLPVMAEARIERTEYLMQITEG